MKTIYTVSMALVGLLLIGFFLPRGFYTPPTQTYNESETICFDCDVPLDPLPIIILTLLLPIIIFVGIAVMLVPKQNSKTELIKNRKD